MPPKIATDSPWTVGRFINDVAASIAPLHLAQSWDNVGLLVGDESQTCTGLLLCIDLTESVLAEAQKNRSNLILAYHPPLFKPIDRIQASSTETDRLIFLAISNGLNIYSMHTALDAADGGTNDVLAEICRLKNVQPLEYLPARTAEKKIVVFVPPEHTDRVADAMFQAGAGRIGEYQKCSYRLSGEGTFFGTETTQPALGKKGRLERVAEIRLESVVPAQHVAAVVQALRAQHPYEEPAFDVYPLDPPLAHGIGRIGELPKPETLAALAARLKQTVGASSVQTVGPAKHRIRRVAVCVGSAGRLTLDAPDAHQIDVTITGEIRHHDALAYQRSTHRAIALGHWASERPVLASLRKRIQSTVGSLPVRISRADRDPFDAV